jgi:uncharacterized alkaline shock family protein YloU
VSRIAIRLTLRRQFVARSKDAALRSAGGRADPTTDKVPRPMTDPNPVRPSAVPQPLHGAASDLGTTPNSLGRTVIADTVVAKIAGIAAREIGGVREVSGGSSRMVGRLRETVPGAFAAPSTAQGVSVEVGARQAAVDIGIVAHYGVALHELAAAIRRNVIAAIERMTGLEVTEVNVTVHDVWFDDEDEITEPDARRRVQ